MVFSVRIVLVAFAILVSVVVEVVESGSVAKLRVVVVKGRTMGCLRKRLSTICATRYKKALRFSQLFDCSNGGTIIINSEQCLYFWAISRR